MDKYEYKVRADEIKDLIARGEYVQAAEIADLIDWRRVKSVMMLCTISDLYKINRRYEDARNMLLLAYERRPGGRTICYSLCELSIKMEDFVPAVNYYKEFVQVAPKDPGRYILQYKLYEAQDVGIEERIGVLEELKKRDYREKWAYELAYLYHRVGLATRCVEECDELILWFGEGKYVIKAMELKMLHQPLTRSQQEKYDHRFDGYEQSAYETPGYQPQQEAASQEPPYYEQEQEPPAAEASMSEAVYDEAGYETAAYGTAGYEEPRYETADYGAGGATQIYEPVTPEAEQELPAEPVQEIMPEQPEELDIQVKPMDMGQYNTINLQAEIAAGLREVLADDRKVAREDEITRAIMAPMLDSETESLDMPEIDEVDENDLGPEAEVMEDSEVFFGETGEIGDIPSVRQQAPEETVEETVPELASVKEIVPELSSVKAKMSESASVKTTVSELGAGQKAASELGAGQKAVSELGAGQETGPESGSAKETVLEQNGTDATAELVMAQLKQESKAEEQVLTAQPPKEIAGVLSQESDGQISLVVPESEQIEKQITGQMNLEDILKEWERMKQESEERRKEEVRQHVLQQTGEMFTAFEAAVRDGLLEQLEGDNAEVPHTAEETAEEETADAEGDVEEISAEQFAEEAPAEEYIEENEDWDSQPQEEAEEEPELVFEEADGVEEIAEIQEPYEQEAYEAEEPAEPEEAEEVQELYEAEESAEPEEPFIEEGAGEEVSAKEEQPQEESAGQAPVERDKGKVRSLTKEEKELYGPFIQSRASREQLVHAIDAISMAAYTGNIIITGEEGMDTVSLAKNMIREVQMTDSNFAGKVAKISGQALNKKDVAATLNQLASGALIIQKAAAMDEETVKKLHKALQKESFGIIIVLEDTKKAMNKLLEQYPELSACFTARMDVEALSNDTLVAFGRQYAKEREYSIDELGILALHTRIDELQTIDHAVTVLEVKELVDNAIRHVNKKTVGHFFDILFARRYDEEDMIILGEKDFV